MSKQSVKYLIISLVIACLIGGFYVMSTKSDENEQIETEESTGQTEQTTSKTEKSPSTGTISGSFTYPSSGIPDDLVACAEDAKTGVEVICSDEQIVDVDMFIYEKGYELEIEAGEYYVYAKTAQGDKAYFNRYMSKVSAENGWPDYDTNMCEAEDEKTLVKVNADAETPNITVGDWYFNSTCNTTQ